MIFCCLDLDSPAHPLTRHDIIQWTYFSDTHIFADNDPDNYHQLEGLYSVMPFYLLLSVDL